MLDQDKSSLPAIQKRIPDLIAEYEAKRDGGSITKEGRDGVVEVVETYKGAEVEVQEFHEMIAHMNFVSVVDGNYVHPGLDIETRLKADDVKMRLLRSAWKGVYDGLNIASIAPVKDRKQIELMLANPPEFTRENIGEHFGDYLLAPRYHVLRGLAEAFTELDPAFKSHSKVKVGVSGLPKRIVIENAFSQDNWGTWGYNQQKVRDVINALQVYRGDPRLDYGDLDGIAKEAEKFGEADWPAGRIKRFKNGNAHLFFDQQGLLDVNRGLAEFYGDVLADSPEEQADQVKRRQST